MYLSLLQLRRAMRRIIDGNGTRWYVPRMWRYITSWNSLAKHWRNKIWNDFDPVLHTFSSALSVLRVLLIRVWYYLGICYMYFCTAFTRCCSQFSLVSEIYCDYLSFLSPWDSPSEFLQFLSYIPSTKVTASHISDSQNSEEIYFHPFFSEEPRHLDMSNRWNLHTFKISCYIAHISSL